MNCIYCSGNNTIKRGTRHKKHEIIQLYYCKDCEKKFTPAIHKHKTYPLAVILDAISYYNRLYTLEEAANAVGEKYGLKISFQNISHWLNDFKDHIPYLRMREFTKNKFSPQEALEESRLFHGQIYEFKYHRAKTECIIQEDYKHYKLKPLQEFLELAVAECPHGLFQDTRRRASDLKNVFDLDGVKIKPKENYAVKNARLVMQAVNDNKKRHAALQDFMILNDSVTVAAEVPVLLDNDDLKHYKIELGFSIPEELLGLEGGEAQASEETGNIGSVTTGHIDLIQIRNGAIHILDFKPNAEKEKPIDQLMIYALALSRLTGIRLYYFKCAWFDENKYFEFFPLHVVHKKKKSKSRI